MRSTIFKKILPTSSLLFFLLPSLALHSLLGWALMQAPLFPKPAPFEGVITIQIIEDRAIMEKMEISLPVSTKIRKKILILATPTPVQREISPAPFEWPKEEKFSGPREEWRSPARETLDPPSPSSLPLVEEGLSPPGVVCFEEETSPTLNEEGLNSAKQGTQEGTIITEDEGKSAGIPGRTAGMIAAGHGKKDFSAMGEGKAGPGVFLLQNVGKGPEGKRDFQSSARGEGTEDRNLSGYLSAVRLKIEKTKRYPEEAQRKGWGGKVILSFEINRRGEVKDIKLVQSSGYRILDEEGIATLHRASPFLSPSFMEKETIALEIPIVFRLENKR